MAAERVVVQAPASVHGDMLDDARQHLTTMGDASDAELIAKAYAACASLLIQGKDAYREATLEKYADVEEALDHLVIAAAGKQYICR
ncbi:hypothetical protein [Arthrobacter sp. VKM Ac-2550]|uniref:hypothetical protein n=1 Tax=Crystallibacter permensis TaxID=1938888 RepID=UPI002228093D|nr:hypothetical protein [Arthrobacter sp. VKM Ac-2550]